MISPSAECRVITPHGDDISAVFSAIQQKKIAATTLPHCLSPSNHSGALVPIQLGIIPTLPVTEKPGERILALLARTLIPLLRQVLPYTQNNGTQDSNHLLIIITLPAKNSVRYAYCPKAAIQDFIYDRVKSTQDFSITFIHEDADLITPFLEAQVKLHQGTLGGFIFGGVDSFLSVKAIRAFEAQQSIRKAGNPDAPLLGEGAAFICLSNQASLLAKTIDKDNILSDMPHSPYWITNRGVRLRAEFEWYESMRDYPSFKDLNELNLQKWVGHLGATQFPLQMALGFYWESIQAASTAQAAPIILYNGNAKKQLILQRYRRFQRSNFSDRELPTASVL